MKSFLRPLYEWFSYSRRERRASVILLFLILTVVLLRYSIPEKRIEIDEFSASIISDASAIIPVTPATRVEESGSIRKNGFQRSVNSMQFRKIELNTCDSSDLERLPGIGPVLSARIIKYRNLLGGFSSVNQLKEVYGLRDSTYLLIYSRVTADSSLIRKINVNSAGFNELNKHPYIERSEAQSILKFRELGGRIENVSILVEEKILTGDKALRIIPYLSFE
jgi:DNA uptake protein ComE-like DNA-binding protein